MDRKELTERILELEWEMFTNATNEGGRASCQDDKPTFLIMRRSQHDAWSIDTLMSYKKDLDQAAQNEMNLMVIKYAYMMEITFPEDYAAFKDRLPAILPGAQVLVTEIMKIHSSWSAEAADKYPKLFSYGRPLTSADSGGSRYAAIDNYLKSELLTYSEPTLMLCLRDTLKAADAGINMSLEILKNTAQSYGYSSLDATEAALGR